MKDEKKRGQRGIGGIKSEVGRKKAEVDYEDESRSCGMELRKV